MITSVIFVSLKNKYDISPVDFIKTIDMASEHQQALADYRKALQRHQNIGTKAKSGEPPPPRPVVPQVSRPAAAAAGVQLCCITL